MSMFGFEFGLNSARISKFELFETFSSSGYLPEQNEDSTETDKKLEKQKSEQFFPNSFPLLD